MPIIGAKGSPSSGGFGQFAQSGAVNYIEDVFSTYLYTGNGTSQTITNGIDLSTKGGLVWYKDRTTAYEHQWVDTVRGAGFNLESPNTSAQASRPTALTAFNTTGFTLGSNVAANGSGDNFVSWTFRKQPKFFDVVTYTGNGVAGRQIAHNLGSAPGFMVVKKTSASGDNWMSWHRSISGSYILLNTTGESVPSQLYVFGNDVIAIDPTSTVFTVASDGSVNLNGATYVAYLFAHDAGGFGLTGTDNVISCGSYTGNSSANGTVINLGYEPQFVMIKRTASGFPRGWYMFDNMRGVPTGGADAVLLANTSGAETTADGELVTFNSTGFQVHGGVPSVNYGDLYIYIAIRRGPMKVPTVGTSVFYPGVGNTNPSTYATGFPIDLAINSDRSGGGGFTNLVFDRLRGSQTTSGNYLQTSTTAAEVNVTAGGIQTDSNTQTKSTGLFGSASQVIWTFRRAPSFFDEVCYTGTGASTFAVTHNLGVKPELAIIKCRSSGSTNWIVGVQGSFINLLRLNTNEAISTNIVNSNFTSTTFVTGNTALGANETTISSNGSGSTYVAYLFATCAGVSKVGSYTGNGSTQTINCGFGSGGARFVLIKRTDSTGDWYVYDTARGMTTLTDPYLLLNTTAAETATLGSVTTVSTGFALNATILSAINTNAASYIFLAIA